MLNITELENKLKTYNIFFVVDDFFGTTFYSTVPEGFGYIGIAYRSEKDTLFGIIWKRISPDQYKITSEFEETPFKLHDKIEALVKAIMPNQFEKFLGGGNT